MMSSTLKSNYISQKHINNAKEDESFFSDIHKSIKDYKDEMPPIKSNLSIYGMAMGSTSSSTQSSSSSMYLSDFPSTTGLKLTLGRWMQRILRTSHTLHV